MKDLLTDPLALITVAILAFFAWQMWTVSRGRIKGDRARELIKAGAVLVDVRSTAEFESGHIEGALNIPIGAIKGRSDELDPSVPVVLYCRTGARSGRAYGILKGKGFAEVYNLGPMSYW